LRHAENFLDLAMTLTFVLWPWKPFQRCALTCWIFVPIRNPSIK